MSQPGISEPQKPPGPKASAPSPSSPSYSTIRGPGPFASIVPTLNPAPKYTPSDTSKPSEPTSTHQRRPYDFAIMHAEWSDAVGSGGMGSNSGGQDPWKREWLIFDVPFTSAKELCKQDATTNGQETHQVSGRAFPADRIGPFPVFDKTGCVYAGGTRTTIGDLTCPGIPVQGITCFHDMRDAAVCGEHRGRFTIVRSFTLTPVVRCEYYI
jgi:hypothetical protein